MGRVEVLRSESKGGDQAEVDSQGHCYPLEVSCFTNQAAPQEQVLESPEQPTQGRARGNRERRGAAVEGERRRRQWIAELQDEH